MNQPTNLGGDQIWNVVSEISDMEPEKRSREGKPAGMHAKLSVEPPIPRKRIFLTAALTGPPSPALLFPLNMIASAVGSLYEIVILTLTPSGVSSKSTLSRALSWQADRRKAQPIAGRKSVKGG